MDVLEDWFDYYMAFLDRQDMENFNDNMRNITENEIINAVLFKFGGERAVTKREFILRGSVAAGSVVRPVLENVSDNLKTY